MVDEAVRDVERHVVLWDDDHARQICDYSSLQQTVVRKFWNQLETKLVFFCLFFFVGF